MAYRSTSHFSTEITLLFQILSLRNFSSCPFLFLQFPFLFRMWFVIEAAKQSFESRPSIQSLSQLIFNAWPGMIPFNMSMYAMLGVSFFEFVPLYQRGILNCQREHNFITTFSLFCSQIYTRRITDRVAIRHISFLFCFVFFPRETNKNFWNFPEKGLLHRASSLVFTPCSHQSWLSLSCWY